MQGGNKETYYIILDSNMVYVKSLDYNIFDTNILKNLIAIRNRYNQYFKGTREIKLIFPDIVIKERYNQEIHKILSVLCHFQSSIKRLEEPDLINALDEVIKQIDKKIRDRGNEFLQKNKIDQMPSQINYYIDRIIDKKISNQKPFRIIEKENETFEKGFCDAIIWYSIINFVNTQLIDPITGCIEENTFIIFLCNDKDFRSEDLTCEFLKETGINIDIIPFSKNCRNDIADMHFNELLRRILQNSQNNSIEQVKIYFSKMDGKIIVNSVYPLPLNINVLSFIPLNANYPIEDFKKVFEPDKLKITNELKTLGFNLETIEFLYLETKIIFVYVNLRDYKSQFLDILDIELDFADDSVIEIEDLDMEISISEFEERTAGDLRIELEIAKLLEKRGFENIDPHTIYLDVVEYVADAD